MKKRSVFWVLLRNELNLRMGAAGWQAAFTLLIYWLFAGAFPLLVLFGDKSSSGNLAALFEAAFLQIMTFLLLAPLTVWIAAATVPAFAEMLAPNGAIPGAIQNLGSFEFLFTRAVDRRLFFRAKTTAFVLIALPPFILNLVIAPFAPEIRFAPADPVSGSAIERRESYMKAFPHSHPATNGTVVNPGQLIIARGMVTFLAWLAWNGILALSLLQSYALLVAKRVNPNRGWTALFPFAPIFLLFGLVAGAAMERSQRQLWENSFLLFATHPLAMALALAVVVAVIQFWSERRFSELEIC